MQIEFDTAEEAIEQVQQGKAWMAIYIGKDFTQDLVFRVIGGVVCALYPNCPHIPDETINGSLIYMYNDATSKEHCHYNIALPFPSLCVCRDFDAGKMGSNL